MIQQPHRTHALRGRAAVSNASGRFERQRRSDVDDGWNTLASQPVRKPTTVHIEHPRAIITRNQSPDVPFEQSVNAYRGCEHGCIYCFARPSHGYMGLSSGQDFETEIFAKPNAAALFEAEITRAGYHPRVIAMGTNTDPYQPIETTQRITRSLLEVAVKHRHPISITTKSDRILRDIDLISDLAKDGLASVMLSVTTLNHTLSRRIEPRAATPAKRLEAIRQLVEAGIPTGVLVAPIIPALTDHEIDWILAASKDAGAQSAGWVMLRLPGEVAPLFTQWLNTHYPERQKRILNALKDMRGGKLNDPQFGSRMRGQGPWADMIKQRFQRAARRHGMKTSSDTAYPMIAASKLPLFSDAHAAPVPIQRHDSAPKGVSKPAETASEIQLSLF